MLRKHEFVIGCKNIGIYNKVIRMLDESGYMRITDSRVNTADGSIEIHGTYRCKRKGLWVLDVIGANVEGALA